MKNYVVKHRSITGIIGALIALIIAYIYMFIVPADTSPISAIQVVLRYAHSLCWVFLAIASLLWGFGASTKWYIFPAYAGLAMYVLFIATFILNKFI